MLPSQAACGSTGQLRAKVEGKVLPVHRDQGVTG